MNGTGCEEVSMQRNEWLSSSLPKYPPFWHSFFSALKKMHWKKMHLKQIHYSCKCIIWSHIMSKSYISNLKMLTDSNSWKQANGWGMMKWHTWSQTLRCSEKWMGRMEWRTVCKSAAGTGRLTSSWSCIQSWCWHPEACRCKRNLHPRVWWYSHRGGFVWKHQGNIFRHHINGHCQILTRPCFCLNNNKKFPSCKAML